jgi:uncharacterized membrane protein YidH (DUF202 family)
MRDRFPSIDDELDADHFDDGNDEKSEKKRAKAEKKVREKEEKERQSAGKAAEREQKTRWDADKIQLKWIRLAILMASIGIGADRTMLELGQAGGQPGDLLVLRGIAQLLALVGLVALAIATFQHGRLISAIVRDEPMPVARFPLSLVVAVIIVLLGVVALVMAITTLGSGSRLSPAVQSSPGAAATAVVAAAAPAPIPDVRIATAASAPASSGAAPAPPPAAPKPAPAPPVAPQAVTAPSPSPTATVVAPVTLVVQGSCTAGARLRQEPVDGEILAVLLEGTRLTAVGATTVVGGQSWQRVRTADGREGWIASELLAVATP